jgi:hypothetical protein
MPRFNPVQSEDIIYHLQLLAGWTVLVFVFSILNGGNMLILFLGVGLGIAAFLFYVIRKDRSNSNLI